MLLIMIFALLMLGFDHTKARFFWWVYAKMGGKRRAEKLRPNVECQGI
jgi:hypothetical protein